MNCSCVSKLRIVLDLRIQAVDLAHMTGRMLVARSAAFMQRDLDERPAKQNRGQWVFAFERYCSGIEQFIAIAVDVTDPQADQSGCPLKGRPPDQKSQRRMNIVVASDEIERPILGLDIIKVGQPLEVRT